MTTVEYKGWARYIDANRGDQRVQQILSVIGAMLANAWGKKNAAPVRASEFSPWINWPEPHDADPAPFPDPLLDGLDI